MRQHQAKIRRRVNTYLKKAFFYLCLTSILFFVFVEISHSFPHKQNIVLSPLGVTHKNVASTNSLKSQIEELLNKNDLQYESVNIQNDSSVLVIMQNNSQVVLSSQKNLSEEIASLQVTIAHLTIEGKSFSRLDFRFDRPIISF